MKYSEYLKGCLVVAGEQTPEHEDPSAAWLQAFETRLEAERWAADGPAHILVNG